MLCLAILLYLGVPLLFWFGAIRAIVTEIEALGLLGRLKKCIDPDHPDRSWLLVLLVTHLMEPWLAVPWLMIVYRLSDAGQAIETKTLWLWMIPLLVLLLPWFGTAGSTRGSGELILGLRIFGSGRIVLVALALLSIETLVIPIVLIGAAIVWLYLDVHWIRRLLVALKKESERAKAKAQRQQARVGAVSELIGQ